MRKLVFQLLAVSLFLSFSEVYPDVSKMAIGKTTIFYVDTDEKGRLTSDINLSSVKELVEYIELYDNWVFELRCHTDSRGSNDFNLKLSAFRAKNLALDLTKNFSVSKNRLVPVGCGEEFMIIPDSVILNIANKKMQEDAHGINRRYELRALRLISEK